MTPTFSSSHFSRSRPRDLGTEGHGHRGGHGLAVALRAILDYGDIITAIVGVSDDGGSSGRLSPALAIPPMGDIRRALLALSPDPSVWRRLMEFRFGDSEVDVAGHSLGNLLIAALTDMSGSFEDALNTAGRLLGAWCRRSCGFRTSHPRSGSRREASAWSSGDRNRTRSDWLSQGESRHRTGGACRVGGDQFSRRDRPRSGSLFTSVIAGLRVPGIADAINGARGTLIYVCNLITQDGETLGMDGAAHVSAHFGRRDSPSGCDRRSRRPGSSATGTGPRRGSGEESGHVVTGDLADPSAEWPAHDAARLGAVLRRLA